MASPTPLVASRLAGFCSAIGKGKTYVDASALPLVSNPGSVRSCGGEISAQPAQAAVAVQTCPPASSTGGPVGTYGSDAKQEPSSSPIRLVPRNGNRSVSQNGCPSQCSSATPPAWISTRAISAGGFPSRGRGRHGGLCSSAAFSGSGVVRRLGLGGRAAAAGSGGSRRS